MPATPCEAPHRKLASEAACHYKTSYLPIQPLGKPSIGLILFLYTLAITGHHPPGANTSGTLYIIFGGSKSRLSQDIPEWLNLKHCWKFSRN